MQGQKVQMSYTEFEPTQDFILVKPEDLQTERTTAGGIIVPIDNTKMNERKTTGSVIAFGPDAKECTAVTTGDMVIWPITDGIDIEFTDGKMVLLKAKSVIGKRKEQF